MERNILNKSKYDELVRNKIFICIQDTSKSFVLKLLEDEVNSITLSELFNRASKQFRYNQISYEIKDSSFQNIYNQNPFDRKIFLEYSEFKLTPIYFEIITLLITSCLKVKTCFGKYQDIDVNLEEDSLDDLKYRIHQFNKNDEDFNKLKNNYEIVFNDTVLEGDKKLIDYKLQNDSQIKLSLLSKTPQNDSQENKKFVDVENENRKYSYEFSSKAPEYRVACEGLNIEGFCKNVKCEYYDKLVISQIGFKSVDVSQDWFHQIKCPNTKCKVKIIPQTCGFTNCVYSYCGIKVVDDTIKLVKSSDILAEKGKYTRYFNDQQNENISNMATWNSLNIIAKKLNHQSNQESVSSRQNQSRQQEFIKFCEFCTKQIYENEMHQSPKGCQNEKKHWRHNTCFEQCNLKLNDECIRCLAVNIN